MRTLHDMRWPYLAARAAVLTLLLVLVSMLHESRGAYVFAPAIDRATLYPARNDDVLVFVKRDGTLFIGYTWVPPAELATELAWLRAHNPRSRFVLSADRHAAFADVRNVIRAARDAGFRRITIDVQPPVLLLERRIRAGFALPRHDPSRLITRPGSDDAGFRLEGMWE
jgi:biopolymer transport protein ExbD